MSGLRKKILDAIDKYSDHPKRSEAMADAVMAVLQEQTPMPPSVPEGWVLVPVDPTPEMICEIERQWMCGSQIDMAKREWKAALAAAPKPEDV